MFSVSPNVPVCSDYFFSASEGKVILDVAKETEATLTEIRERENEDKE